MENWNIKAQEDQRSWKKRFAEHMGERKRCNNESIMSTKTIKNRPNDLYEFYKESLQTRLHTLEQIQAFSFIETHCKSNASVLINKLKYYDYDLLNVIEAEEGMSPNFESFKRKFNSKLNDLLGAILGKDGSLDIFYEEKDNPNNQGHVISEEEARFLLYLFASHQTKDAESLVEKNYTCVGDSFLDEVRSGIETLIDNGRLPHMTKEDLAYRFDVTFKRRQMKIEEALERVAMIAGDIATFIVNQPDSQNDYEQCIDILSECEHALLKLSSKPSSTTLPDHLAKDYESEIKKYK